MLLEKYRQLSQAYSERMTVVRGGTLLKAFGATTDNQTLWKGEPCLPLELVKAKRAFDAGEIARAVARVRKCLPELIDPSVRNDICKRTELLNEISLIPEYNSRIVHTIVELPSLDLSVADWTRALEETCMDYLCLPKPYFVLKQGKYRTIHRQKMADLFKEGANCRFVTTIHSVKGKTFDSLMLILSKNSAGANISVSDIKKPEHFLSEKERLIYVAMSRPRYQLVIAMPREAGRSEDDIKNILGSNVSIMHV
jgi:hypothetical protein